MGRPSHCRTDASEQPSGGTGGPASLHITLGVAYIQTVAYLLPFATGLSLTRRTFNFGNVLFAVLESLVYGTVFYVGRLPRDPPSRALSCGQLRAVICCTAQPLPSGSLK